MDPLIISPLPSEPVRGSSTLEGMRSLIHSSKIADRHASTSTELTSSLLSIS
jgi:hypothetical protein